MCVSAFRNSRYNCSKWGFRWVLSDLWALVKFQRLKLFNENGAFDFMLKRNQRLLLSELELKLVRHFWRSASRLVLLPSEVSFNNKTDKQSAWSSCGRGPIKLLKVFYRRPMVTWWSNSGLKEAAAALISLRLSLGILMQNAFGMYPSQGALRTFLRFNPPAMYIDKFKVNPWC